MDDAGLTAVDRSECPIAARRERLAVAVAFLKRRCILVDALDRFAQVRLYRVSGKRQPMLAEQVIDHAIAKGMRDA